MNNVSAGVVTDRHKIKYSLCMLAEGLKIKITILVDIDECPEASDDCDDNAECVNSVPSYNCTCYDGYEGNGTFCEG